MIYILCTFLIGLAIIVYAMLTAPIDSNEKNYAITYVVYYQPNISVEGKNIIKTNLNSTMSSLNTFVYKIEDIFLQVKNDMPIQDLSFLANLEKR